MRHPTRLEPGSLVHLARLEQRLCLPRTLHRVVALQPWVTGLEADELEALVRSKGLHLLDHLSSDECIPRYLPTRSTDGASVAIRGQTAKTFVMAANEHMMRRM